MPKNRDVELQVRRAVARIQARMLAVSLGLVAGCGLFLMTAWLIIKGGEHVGRHLQLLDNYLFGYSVTWPGAFMGFMWGVLIGGAIGWAIARLYNLIVSFRFR